MAEQQREALEALESIGRAVCITRHGTIPITVEKAAMECFREEFNTIRAALSHAEGEAVDHWAVRNPGLADQFRAEAQAVRKRLGFESDADDVSPNDLRERIAEIEGAPQVAGLTETAIKSSPAYRALHREKEHLLGLLKDQAPQVAVPEGYALVPEDMLTHFRDFHDAVKTLSKTADPDGYWEHQCEVCKRIESQLAAAPTAPAGEQGDRLRAGTDSDPGRTVKPHRSGGGLRPSESDSGHMGIATEPSVADRLRAGKEGE